MSMLTHELQRSKLAEATKHGLHPGMTRNLSNGSSTSRGGLGERGFSSSSLGRDKIEEEQELFSMEEEDSEGAMSMAQAGLMNGREPTLNGRHADLGKTSRYGVGAPARNDESLQAPIGGHRTSK